MKENDLRKSDPKSPPSVISFLSSIQIGDIVENLWGFPEVIYDIRSLLFTCGNRSTMADQAFLIPGISNAAAFVAEGSINSFLETYMSKWVQAPKNGSCDGAAIPPDWQYVSFKKGLT